jgi:glutamyl-Q tRNA(Asp) synthetase
MFRTRFAPSPTGYLHLGHVLSAMYVWGIARFLKAEIILRIEDHDQKRCKKKFEEAILKDLAWLGFIAEHGVKGVDEKSDFRQSDCEKNYSQVFNELKNKKLIYSCSCSRQDLKERLGISGEGEEIFYDGFCRGKKVEDKGRVRLIMKDKREDFLIRDQDDQWTYQFAVTVDDFTQGINLVIRGEDLLESTARQIYLWELISGNKSTPQYFHHKLIKDDSGQKLSKRFFSEAIGKMREDGYTPEQLLSLAAEKARLGTFPKGLAVKDLADVFAKVATSFIHLFP